MRAAYERFGQGGELRLGISGGCLAQVRPGERKGRASGRPSLASEATPLGSDRARGVIPPLVQLYVRVSVLAQRLLPVGCARETAS